MIVRLLGIQPNGIPSRTGRIAGDIGKTKLARGVPFLPHLILTDRKHAVVAEGFGIDALDRPIETAGQ